MSLCFLFFFPLLFSGVHIYSFLNDHLEEMAKDLRNPDELTTGLHVWPDFHGNRSPLADQSLKGMVSTDFKTLQALTCRLIESGGGD